MKRNYFLKKMGIAAALIAVRPDRGLGGPLQQLLGASGDLADEGGRVDLNEGIIDLHCHPSLKIYLLNKEMWKHHHPGPGPNMIHMQVDLEQLQSGCVKGFMATHYLVEASIEQEWDTLKRFWRLLTWLLHGISRKIENEDESNVRQIGKMIDLLECQIRECNERQKSVEFVVARSYSEFEDAIRDGKLPLAHAIEGAHALGRNRPISKKRIQVREEALRAAQAAGGAPVIPRYRMTPDDDPNDPDKYLKHLEELHRRGVCMMTLSHFFRNDIAYPIDGISVDGKKAPGMAWEYTPDKDHGLTEVGVAVVKRMLEIGMVVDLNHTTPGVRRDVFALNRQSNAERVRAGKPPRPLVFTHTGAQVIYDYYDQDRYPFYKYYCVSDEEIAAIEECNGVIGVLAENFWLTGADTHLAKDFPPAQFRDGIAYVIETMKYINSRTNGKHFDHVAIGTDFDGLADAPRDLYIHSQLRDLFTAMRADPDIPEEAIVKICSTNALRVLKAGWGNPTATAG
ncbi:MAG TPA: membrane dipeptidase [Puia sp.]|nr:membrane dipeptidase [Puia sp.]